jgi:hypothetical protein
MNNRPVSGRSSETQSHPINMNNIKGLGKVDRMGPRGADERREQTRLPSYAEDTPGCN